MDSDARESKALRRNEPIRIPTADEASAPEDPNAFADDVGDEDQLLLQADDLSREELIRRRSRRLRRLVDMYRNLYWALAEEVRVRHRDFYWEHGVSPVVEDEEDESGGDGVGDGGGRGRVVEENAGLVVGDLEGAEATGRAGAGGGLGIGRGEGSSGRREERKRCAFAGCKSKAMPLTRFCHPHILADKKQTLYKACNYVTKSCGQSGPLICGKPILVSSMPSLCHVHHQKVQRGISQAMKRAGLGISSSSRPVPKFSILIASYVRQIQARRKAMNSTVKTDNG